MHSIKLSTYVLTVCALLLLTAFVDTYSVRTAAQSRHSYTSTSYVFITITYHYRIAGGGELFAVDFVP